MKNMKFKMLLIIPMLCLALSAFSTHRMSMKKMYENFSRRSPKSLEPLSKKTDKFNVVKIIEGREYKEKLLKKNRSYLMRESQDYDSFYTPCSVLLLGGVALLFESGVFTSSIKN